MRPCSWCDAEGAEAEAGADSDYGEPVGESYCHTPAAATVRASSAEDQTASGGHTRIRYATASAPYPCVCGASDEAYRGCAACAYDGHAKMPPETRGKGQARTVANRAPATPSRLRARWKFGKRPAMGRWVTRWADVGWVGPGIRAHGGMEGHTTNSAVQMWGYTVVAKEG